MTAPRVRFAPSPTGWLHVGGARTALFNWLYARQHGGTFVIRSEDTDVERSSGASERGVLDDLRWLGLEWDEGPDIGGPLGPYRQSQRLGLYEQQAKKLLASGAAYRCYCTDAELDERRQAALAAGRPPHYDGRCRDLTDDQRAVYEAAGRAASVRFRVPEREWTLHDRVRGEVTFPAGMVGDFVLLRSTGLPTYNFAAAVDDHAMRITHVIRAEEHLANTPRQLMIYAALGATPPEFAHVPLILNRDRTKMSKREGEASVAVGDWRKAGFVADALVSYLALLGFHPGDDREILSRRELLDAFTLDRVGKSGSVFDPDKLRWLNGHVLHTASGETLLLWCVEEFLDDAFMQREQPEWSRFMYDLVARKPADLLSRLLELVRGNLATLADLPGELAPFVSERYAVEDEARAALAGPDAARVRTAAADALEALADWNADAVKSAIQSVGKQLGVKGRDLFQPLRAALTGRTHGPELPQVVVALGRERAIVRLRAIAAGEH